MRLAAVLLSLSFAGAAASSPMPQSQVNYTQACGGCHGLLGVSAKREVPSLRDRVGALLCTREGRDYVVRLPNVAFASMDDKALAETLNFMMFSLGGKSLIKVSPSMLKPFTASEVRSLRGQAYKARDVYQLRDTALSTAEKSCLTSQEVAALTTYRKLK
jgi:hypothetical protein